MSDGCIGIEIVHPDKDAVVLATGGLAGGGAEDGVDDGAVGVVEDGEGIAGGGRRYVGGLSDLVAGVDDDIGGADVFVEGAFIGEGDGGGGNGGPEGGGGIDHGGGLLVGDDGRERALIDVVVELAAGPVDGLAEDAGIEEGGAGDIFWASGAGGGSESEKGNCERMNCDGE